MKKKSLLHKIIAANKRFFLLTGIIMTVETAVLFAQTPYSTFADAKKDGLTVVQIDPLDKVTKTQTDFRELSRSGDCHSFDRRQKGEN
jgi:hypothetical protein